MKYRILFHDHCFDGACSAALFGRFVRERVDAGAEIEVRGLQHAIGDAFAGAFEPAVDRTACVDFRYHQRLDWWFDHHVSGFPSAGDRAHFQADRSGQKYFDAEAPSCTGFIARVLAERHGFRADDLAETVRWADIIDTARFPDAATVVRLASPALELAAVLEASRDHDERVRLIGELARRPLEEIVRLPGVADAVRAVRARIGGHVALVRGHARDRGDGVIVYDLADAGEEAVNKFIPYDLYPECRYVVGLQRGGGALKITVGQNPWSPHPRPHHVATLCERHGGGGHAAVGGVTLPGDQLDRARAVVDELVRDLRAG